MTTLRQILEAQLKANAWLGYTTLTKGQVLLCVKKWLQQKRESEVDSLNETAQCHIRIGLLNELLEGLEQWQH